MEDFLKELLVKIVEYDDQVSVTKEEDEGAIIFHLSLAQDDLGRVIGRRGQTINAIRNLLILYSRTTEEEDHDSMGYAKRIVLNVGQDDRLEASGTKGV